MIRVATIPICASLLFSAALHAPLHAEQQDAGSSAYLSELGATDPAAAKALKKVGQSYQEKCGAEPTLEQYKLLAASSDAYRHLQAMSLLQGPDYEAWNKDAKDRYAALIKQMTCFK